tara:strand:- start:11 stop:211 length:201 start_codon:yes stop_codon:yes gene_type:complete
MTAKQGLRRAIKAVGTKAELARKIGVSRTTVLNWDVVPVRRLKVVSRVTGIPARMLRPDIAKIFDA